jgi:DNA-binding response OmpR family regulator
MAVSTAVAAPRQRAAAGTRAVRSEARRILLVEDDEDTRQLLAVALEAQGYEVAQADTADQGLDCLRAHRFDLVLSDYDLPGKTGAAMLREAHAAGTLDRATTLIVTAHPDPEGVEEAAVVRKPLDLEKFLRQVRGIFESMPSAPRVGPPPAAEGAPAGEPSDPPLDLALYISAGSPHSAKARHNMEKLLSAFRTADIGFAVYDLALEPQRAEADNVVFTPTLVKRRPMPRAWILGDLSDPAVVTDLLHLCGIDPLP